MVDIKEYVKMNIKTINTFIKSNKELSPFVVCSLEGQLEAYEDVLQKLTESN